MKKENVKIKSNITIVDEISAIQSIVEYYFTDGEYTPYYADMAKIVTIAQNFLDGVEFEDEDYVYECVIQNDDLYKCVNKFLVPSTIKADAQYYNRMERIMKQVEDIVEFKKQKLIHNTDAFGIVGDMCMALKDIIDGYVQNTELAKTFITDLQESGITEETLTNAVRNAADQFKMPNNEIIEGQRQRIAEQQKQLQEQQAKIEEMKKRVKEMDTKVQSFETWKREYMARNVKVVKGSGKIAGGSKKKTSGKTTKDE